MPTIFSYTRNRSSTRSDGSRYEVEVVAVAASSGRGGSSSNSSRGSRNALAHTKLTLITYVKRPSIKRKKRTTKTKKKKKNNNNNKVQNTHRFAVVHDAVVVVGHVVVLDGAPGVSLEVVQQVRGDVS